MAQYCYYNGDSSNPIKRLNFNGNTYRKVSVSLYNVTKLWVLDSWQSCSGNFPYTYTLYSEDKNIPKANHTYYDFTYTLSQVYMGSLQPEERGTAEYWDDNFSLWDLNNHYTNVYNSTRLTINWTKVSGSVYSRAENVSGNRLSQTITFRQYNGGTQNVQTNSSYTYSKANMVGNSTRYLEFQFQTSVKPNNGNIAPLSQFYNGFADEVSGKSTTRYGYNENPGVFNWNTW